MARNEGLLALGLMATVGACVDLEDASLRERAEAVTLQVDLEVSNLTGRPLPSELTLGVAWNHASGPQASITSQVEAQGPYPQTLELRVDAPPPEAMFELRDDAYASGKHMAVGYLVALRFEDKRTGEPLLPTTMEQTWSCSYGVANDYILVYLEEDVSADLLQREGFPPLSSGYHLLRATRFGTPRPDTCLGSYLICTDECDVRRDLCEEVDSEERCDTVFQPCIDACLQLQDPSECPAEEPLFVHEDDALTPVDFEQRVTIVLGGEKEDATW